MRLKILLIASIATSCAAPSKRPSLRVCVIDGVEALCGDKDSPLKRVPARSIDKHICLSPDDWKDLEGYVEDLENE